MNNTLRNTERKFTIGSEWLYYTIYIGLQTSDKFLISGLYPLTVELIDENIIDKWFFIRYKDDAGMHLRVRFHLCDTENTNKIITNIHRLVLPQIQAKLISNITLNTYNRELERYGFNTIEEFETLFFINSKLILDIIKLSDDNLENRWLFGMKSIDSFLDVWDFNLEEKKQLLESLKSSFGKEFGIDKEIRKQLSKKYRDNKYKIEKTLNDPNEELDILLNDFKLESKIHVDHIIKKTSEIDANNALLINDFLGSYLHMHCNRLFQSKQRKHEWILYDLLYEYYYSKLARSKNTKHTQKTFTVNLA